MSRHTQTAQENPSFVAFLAVNKKSSHYCPQLNTILKQNLNNVQISKIILKVRRSRTSIEGKFRIKSEPLHSTLPDDNFSSKCACWIEGK